jgi:hypothetical protein
VQTGWKKTARESFFRNLNEIKTARSSVGENITIYPFLKVLPAEIYVDIIMKVGAISGNFICAVLLTN